MPYKFNKDLPNKIQNHLPEQAQDIYREAYNKACERYQDPKKRHVSDTIEEVAHKVAWSAVKEKYAQKNDKWIRRD